MIDLCTKCKDPGRDKCMELCAEAEAWASQDEVLEDPQHIAYVGRGAKLDYLALESTLTFAEMQSDTELSIEDWHFCRGANLTEQQMQCMWLYYWDKRTQSYIANELEISQQMVAKHLKYSRKKVLKMIKKLSKKG